MLTWMAIGSFLTFPPILLVVKFFKKYPSGWLLAFLIVAYTLLGWASVLYVYVDQQTHIGELIKQGRDAELPEGWDSDGASGVFALYLGWLLPLVNFLFWLLVYFLAASLKFIFATKKSLGMQTEPNPFWNGVVVMFRWLLFVLVMLIQFGAFLGGNYITGTTGLVFGLFLAVHQSKVAAYTKKPYSLLFTGFALLFLLGSYMDMKYVQPSDPSQSSIHPT